MTGLAGSGIAFLDALLVTGYGALPAAGWTKEFTGTNTAVYRFADGLTRYYLDVDDSGTGPALANVMVVRGYKTMTGIATGTNPFPTVAQEPNGIWWVKSNTADATVRPWRAWADRRTVLIHFQAQHPFFFNIREAGFGQFASYKAADDKNGMLHGQRGDGGTFAVTQPWQYVPVDATGADGSTGGSIPTATAGIHTWNGTAGALGRGALTLPNPLNAGRYPCRLYIQITTGGTTDILGRHRAYLDPAQRETGAYTDEVGGGVYTGRTFTFVSNGAGDTGSQGAVIVGWETRD